MTTYTTGTPAAEPAIANPIFAIAAHAAGMPARVAGGDARWCAEHGI